MPTLPEDELDALARFAVNPYLFRYLEEDQIAEARLAIFLSEETERPHLIKVGRDAAVQFLRDWHGRNGQRRPAFSLDDFFHKPRRLHELPIRMGDLIPAPDQWGKVNLLIWAEQVWEKLCRISTRQEMEVMYRWIWCGQTQAAMAAGMNRHINRIYQLQTSCLARYRQREGIPKPESKTGAARRWHPGEKWAERGKKGAAEAARRRNESRNHSQSDPPVEGGGRRSGRPREHPDD